MTWAITGPNTLAQRAAAVRVLPPSMVARRTRGRVRFAREVGGHKRLRGKKKGIKKALAMRGRPVASGSIVSGSCDRFIRKNSAVASMAARFRIEVHGCVDIQPTGFWSPVAHGSRLFATRCGR